MTGSKSQTLGKLVTFDFFSYEIREHENIVSGFSQVLKGDRSLQLLGMVLDAEQSSLISLALTDGCSPKAFSFLSLTLRALVTNSENCVCSFFQE